MGAPKQPDHGQRDSRLPDLSDECAEGKHWLCDDPLDCSCPCHEGDEEED